MAYQSPAGKSVLRVVPRPPRAVFVEQVFGSRHGAYETLLLKALNGGECVLITADDHYKRAQLRKAAKKIKVNLTYHQDGRELFVLPVRLDGELRRLMLLLREKRTIAQLEAAVPKLQLTLKTELPSLAERKLAHFVKDAWVLTENGMDFIDSNG